MWHDLTSLLLRILFFGTVLLIVHAIFRRPLISASLAFWFGWAFLLTGGMIAYANEWRAFSSTSASYLKQMFDGAFVSFLLANIIPSRKPVRSVTTITLKVRNTRSALRQTGDAGAFPRR